LHVIGTKILGNMVDKQNSFSFKTSQTNNKEWIRSESKWSGGRSGMMY